MPTLRRIVPPPGPVPRLGVRGALAVAIVVGGLALTPTLAGAQPAPGTTTSSTTTSSTTTTAPVPVTLTPNQVQQMSALQAQITQTGAVLDQLAGTYETDSAQLTMLQQHEVAIRAQVAVTQRRVTATRTRLRADALIAYMG